MDDYCCKIVGIRGVWSARERRHWRRQGWQTLGEAPVLRAGTERALVKVVPLV